jgi:hypothetical protein
LECASGKILAAIENEEKILETSFKINNINTPIFQASTEK